MNKLLVGESWIRSPNKRRQDILLISALLPLVAPLGGLSMAAALEDGKKPFFRQVRIGQDNQPFNLYKIRTMPSSEYFDSSLGNSDPRATRVGRVLRKLTLDETPQFINILRGEMSVVGPRPLIQPDIDALRDNLSQSEYSEWFRAYALGRPGWFSRWGNKSHHEVALQTDEAYLKRAELDVEYMHLASSNFDKQVIKEALTVAGGFLTIS